VHQGDQDGAKGVYHINAVDEITQWEVVGSVEQISEAFVGDLTVFNVGGNNYRIVAFVHYRKQIVYVKRIGTHKEYDKWDL
jgi:mRNA-degrading endonuclease HigB of HigAB toxin-antitoxin module